MPLLQVRQAARTLGVHENTLRRWEERGFIRAVRLPSGVRRFRSEDVEALRAQILGGVAPVVETPMPAEQPPAAGVEQPRRPAPPTLDIKML